MLGCVIMAAGNAVRFGANKLEAELDGKPLGGKDPALLDKLQKAYQQWFNEETAK